MDSMQGIMSQSAQVLDRRPIATRDRKWARVTASWLASRRVSPNAISLAGMFACIVAGIALAATSIAYHRIEWLIAARYCEFISRSHIDSRSPAARICRPTDRLSSQRIMAAISTR